MKPNQIMHQCKKVQEGRVNCHDRHAFKYDKTMFSSLMPLSFKIIVQQLYPTGYELED